MMTAHCNALHTVYPDISERKDVQGGASSQLFERRTFTALSIVVGLSNDAMNAPSQFFFFARYEDSTVSILCLWRTTLHRSITICHHHTSNVALGALLHSHCQRLTPYTAFTPVAEHGMRCATYDHDVCTSRLTCWWPARRISKSF